MEIEELRSEIDSIDRNLLSLMAKRLQLALEINRAKQRAKLPLRDSSRERRVLATAAHGKYPPILDTEAAAIMRAVLDFSRTAVKRRIATEDLKPLNIAMVGIGMVGGSVAKALKRAMPAHKLMGVDLPEQLDGPGLSGLFDGLVTPKRSSDAVRSADVVFLCAPPAQNLELLEVMHREVADATIVTDVGGVKQRICDRARLLYAVPGPVFVGGHPMAGKAQSGFEYSSAELFQDRAWILTPDAGTDVEPLRVLKSLIESTGAAVQLLTPEEHDRLVPAVSHLPQLASVALMLTIGGRDRGVGGPALRDMTRLAESSPALWEELLASSRETVVGEIQRFRAYLTELEIALGLGENVTNQLERARALRQRMMDESVTELPPGE